MSDLLTDQAIRDITGLVKPACQERALRNLGYIVLGRNAKNEVRALARHPRDPSLTKDSPERVTLDW